MRSSRMLYFVLIVITIALGLLSRKVAGVPTFIGDFLWAVMVFYMVSAIFIERPFATLPGISYREMNFLNGEIVGLSENQMRKFLMLYAGKRKTEQDMLIFSIVGLLLVPGLQRFITGQVGMGLLYLFTIGLCFIGSIVDLINYKKAAFEYNEKVGYECYQMAKMGV